MVQPALTGRKVECLWGNDITWMRFNSEGQFWVINPENDFFRVALGNLPPAISIPWPKSIVTIFSPIG